MTDALDEIQKRLEAATPGPRELINGNEGTNAPAFWEVVNDAYANPTDEDLPALGVQFECGTKGDAELFLHAPTDLRMLLRLVREYSVALEKIARLDFKFEIEGDGRIARDALTRGEGIKNAK